MELMEQTNILPGSLLHGKELSFSDFVKYSQESLARVFGISAEDPKSFAFKQYLKNADHGSEHSYNVYKRACAAADVYEKETNNFVDRALLYVMSAMHDSGRFRYSVPSDSDTVAQMTAKDKKRAKAEKEHARYGLAQINLAKQILKKNGIEISPEDYEKLKDYILNHDFFNTRLDGYSYAEPKSIEGQIARLADRTSVPVVDEIDRYWETGKRLGTPYFIENIDLQDRLDFSFPKIGSYIKSGKFDEFTFFLALLSQSQYDFKNSILASMYQDWAKSKHAGVARILSIAKEEGYTEEQLKKMEILIKEYFAVYEI